MIWLLLYLGGCLAVAMVLVAVARGPEAPRSLTRPNRRAVIFAALLCAGWLPMMVLAILAPRLFARLGP